MGYKNREERETESCLSEALLFATMCIIGLPVDVHIRDGSVYSGTFHTASFDKENGVVLKEARLTKKGKSSANIVNGSVVETLVILSADIVQVVAKGVMFPADGVTGNMSGDDIAADMANPASSKTVASEAKKSNKSIVDKKKAKQNRNLTKNENGSSQSFLPTKAGNDHEGRTMPQNHIDKAMEVEHGKRDGINISKREEASGGSVNGRQKGNGWSQGEQDLCRQKLEFQRGKSGDEVHSSNGNRPCLMEIKPVDEGQETMKLLPNSPSCDPASELIEPDNQCSGRPAPMETSSPNAVCANVSTASCLVVGVPSEAHCSSLATSAVGICSQGSESNRSSKEFKLNPGAKIFSPSFSNPISITAPAVPKVASVAYVPTNSPMVAAPAIQPEFEIPFGPQSTAPVKFPPYNNLTVMNGGSGSQFSQPVVGHIGTRTQPIRYAGQYHAVQAAPTYAPPNSQGVMVGRLGQVVYVQPVPHDLVPSTTAISSVPACPLLTPQHVQYPKHQGNAASQALQLYMTPSFVAGGQQPFAVPSQIPLLQTPIPAIRPIPVPGCNPVFSTKFP